MLRSFCEYTRCAGDLIHVEVASNLSACPGFFRLGGEHTLYGRAAVPHPALRVTDDLPVVNTAIADNASTPKLPFDPDESMEALRTEQYLDRDSLAKASPFSIQSLVRMAYYAARPLLPVAIRKHFQRFWLRGWDQIPFPNWPVDSSVESITEYVWKAIICASGEKEIPFIWFWPEGYQGCSIMTHDVETACGRDFCSEVMDMDDGVTFKSSFEVVPEIRYDVPGQFLAGIRDRGFEVNVHGLNHDGNLFRDRHDFTERAKRINAYAREWDAIGFRSPVLYRNAMWMGELEFDYDMSFPNVGHLDPQGGGCCTVMPYFIGELVELPLTTIQDYSLFNVLQQFSVDIWIEQMKLIREHYGLISFIVHPDYIRDGKARAVYKDLLLALAEFCERRNVWKALPREVSLWWRQRSKMTIVEQHGQRRIKGPGSNLARLAYAMVDKGNTVYRIAASNQNSVSPDGGRV